MKRVLLFTLFISFIGYSQNKNPQPNYDVKFQNSIKRSVENINLYDYDELIDVFISDFEFFKNQFLNSIIVDESLINKIDLFFYNLKNNTIRNVDFQLDEEGVLGVSKSIYDDNRITLSINPELWRTSSTFKKLYVFYHELGHDILNFKHGQGGKMMFTISEREYSSDEFYYDRGYMFMNFFKRFFNDLGYIDFVIKEGKKEEDFVYLVTWDDPWTSGKSFNSNFEEDKVKVYLYGKPFSGKGVNNFEFGRGKSIRYFDNGVWRNNEYLIYNQYGEFSYKSEPKFSGNGFRTYSIHMNNRFLSYEFDDPQFFTKNIYYIDDWIWKIDDLENGEIKYMYPNGKVERIERYREWIIGEYNLGLKRNGEQISYYQNGNKRTVGVYEYGELINYIWFDEDGNEEEKVDDVSSSLQTYWERGFNNVEKSMTKDNLGNDVTSYYNKKGKMIRHVITDSYGRKQGEEVKFYYDSGGVRVKTMWVDDLKQGEQIWFYGNGNVERIYNYVDDKQEGEKIEYYKSGVIKSKSNYVNGSLQGKFELFYENGISTGYIYYSDGKYEGDYRRNYENGEIKITGTYKNDLKNGIFKFYNKNGEVEKIEVYENGKLLEN